MRLWDTTTGEQLLCLEERIGPITTIDFSPDGKWIMAGTKEGTISIWNSQNGALLYRCNQQSEIIHAWFLSGGSQLLVANSSPSLQKWDILYEDNKILLNLAWSSNKVLSADNVMLDGFKGLSESNKQLLLQHGAISSRNTESKNSEEKKSN